MATVTSESIRKKSLPSQTKGEGQVFTLTIDGDPSGPARGGPDLYQGAFGVKVILLVMLGLVQISCATIMNGTKQTIGFESEPPGATVSIAGNVIGQTPGSTELNRGTSYTLQFAKDGYESSYVNVNNRFAHALEATIGNIWNVFLGLYVDVLSGGALELEPNHIKVILTKASDEKKR